MSHFLDWKFAIYGWTLAKVTLSHGIEKEFEGQEIEGYFIKPIVL